MKLTKALIKKYGVSKKAWAVLRSQNRTPKRSNTTMARRKSRSTSKRSRSKGFGGSLGGLVTKMISAAAYGAIRQKGAEAIAPITSQVPMLGNNADEVGMIILAEVVKKAVGNKVPYVKQIAETGQLIEAAQIGQNLASGGLAGFGGKTTGGYSF